MSQDTFVKADTMTLQGSISTDQGHITSDGVNGTLTTVGMVNTTQTVTTANLTNANVSSLYGGMSATATLTTAGTISSSVRVARVTAGSAVTGIVMATGTQPGQELTVIHTGAAASSITFSTAGSAAGSSNLATDFVISGLTCSKYVWDVVSALWYPVVF